MQINNALLASASANLVFLFSGVANAQDSTDIIQTNSEDEATYTLTTATPEQKNNVFGPGFRFDLSGEYLSEAPSTPGQGLDFSHQSELDLDLHFGSHVTTSIGLDGSDIDYATITLRNSGTIGFLGDNSRIELGILDDVREFEGAMDNFYEQGLTPMAGFRIGQEKIDNLQGARMFVDVPFGDSAWTWRFQAAAGTVRGNVPRLTPADAFGHIERYDISVAPAVREQLHGLVDDIFEHADPRIIAYFPDAERDARAYINGLSDDRIQNAYQDVVDELLPFIPFFIPDISSEEFLAIVGGLGHDVDNIGIPAISGAFDMLRAGRGTGDQHSIFLKTSLDRETDRSSLSMGIEAGRVMPGDRGSVEEDYVSLFVKASRDIGTDWKLKGLFSVIGYDGYLNLNADLEGDKKLMNAFGVAFGAVEWTPDRFDRRLTLHAGAGVTYDYYLGFATHQEVAAKYHLISRDNTDVSIFGSYGISQYQDSPITSLEGREENAQFGVSFNYSFN